MKTALETCKDIIINNIANEYQLEAIEIVSLMKDKHQFGLIAYDKLNKGNLICLVLDKAKFELINEGKLIRHNNDMFGNSDLFI